MKVKITATLLATAMAIGMMTAVTAQTQESDVSVNVSDTVALDARPSALSYGEDGGEGISPGADVTTSDDGFQHIDIENIGSVPIEQVHAEATMHNSQPFGSTGNDAGTQFNTGNFFTLSTDTAQGDYNLDGVRGPRTMHYLNRVEYAESNPPEYLFLEESGPIDVGGSSEFSSITDTDVGRFRVGEAEYFYVLYQGSATTGTSDQWVLRIGETPHTPNQIGTVDFRNQDNVDGEVDYHEINVSSADSTGTTDQSLVTSKSFVTFDTGDSSGFDGQSLLDGNDVNSTALGEVTNGEEREYNLYVDGANDQIIRTSFNTALSSPDGTTWNSTETNSGAQVPIFRSSTGGQRLQPGQNFPIDVGIQLPNGIDRTRIAEGTVTILATENTGL